MAKTAKGSIRKVEISCVAWIDLLGYGALIKESGFNPANKSADVAIKRLDRLHQCVSKLSNRYLPTLAMNDGIIVYRDLSPRTHNVTYDFLTRCIDLFNHINEIDIGELGHPGARMVISPGFRIRRNLNFNSYLFEGKGRRIKDKFAAGEISAEQAINEALMSRQYFDSNPELQGNFALTRAYLAESSGSKAGFSGANCFIDLSLFSSPNPKWINFSKIIPWSIDGIDAEFGCLESIDRIGAGKARHAGILDAFDIAVNLSKDKEIEKKLRSQRFVVTR
ncbi:hypothetical protein [Serratia marcescens]|uniref:hypothetical protein n=1 Tax=Serratia marcescens TaxID=615 RepID=UPI003204BB16